MEIKRMGAEDCKRMPEIDASHHIHRAWREIDGKLELVNIDYFDPTWPNGYEDHYRSALLTVKKGLVLGAFENDSLIGILTIEPMEKWSDYSYGLLDQLFVSKPYRGKGIGTRLFNYALSVIDDWSLDRILICAGSAEETIAFYRKLGCVEPEKKNQEMYDDDPRDMQLEYLIKNT